MVKLRHVLITMAIVFALLIVAVATLRLSYKDDSVRGTAANGTGTSIGVDMAATLVGDAAIVAGRSNCPRLIAVRPCNPGRPPVVV
jgi:heme A synthase